MLRTKISSRRAVSWTFSRVGVIYLILFVFSLTCVDLKMLGERIKVRHLNDNIPDFTNMIIYSQDPNAVKDMDWRPYKIYFRLILRYLPKDLITMNLLGYVDHYVGKDQDAISLFKDSSEIDGKFLFLPNYNLGVLYYKKGMWPQSAQYLFKAIASNPKLSVLLMEKSIIYRQIAANHFFKYSLTDEIYDAQSRAYILLLSSLHNMRQYDKMMVISDLGLKDPNLSYKDSFYYYTGLAFLETGQINNALMLFQKSLTIEKGNPDVYYYLANIYEKAGQLEQARELLNISYALHQKNDPRFPYESHTDLRFF